MSDEEVGFDGNLDLDGIRILLSLQRLGELIAHIAAKFAELRGIEQPDFDGAEMREIAVSGWEYVLHMSDREEFVAGVKNDLAGLDKKHPEHRSEFGL